jgi:hypothetical protein
LYDRLERDHFIVGCLIECNLIPFKERSRWLAPVLAVHRAVVLVRAALGLVFCLINLCFPNLTFTRFLRFCQVFIFYPPFFLTERALRRVFIFRTGKGSSDQ